MSELSKHFETLQLHGGWVRLLPHERRFQLLIVMPDKSQTLLQMQGLYRFTQQLYGLLLLLFFFFFKKKSVCVCVILSWFS